MPLNEKQRKQILSLVGEAGLKRILEREQQARKDSTLIEAMGVRHKAYLPTTPNGFTRPQLKWIAERLGEKAAESVLKASSFEQGLEVIRKIAAVKNGQQTKSASHTNTVRITPSAGNHATVYKGIGGQIVDDQTKRVAAYVQLLGMPTRLDVYTRQLIGEDTTEDVYRLAASYVANPMLMGKGRKSLNTAELGQLEDQQMQAIGTPDSVRLALGTVLQSRYSQFVSDLQTSLFWHTSVKGKY